MQWLEAMLAFSVVMMILSTMVSVVVETIHRVAKLRQDGLRRLVKQLYKDVIGPKIRDQKIISTFEPKAFAEQLTTVRYQPISKQSWWITKLLRSRLEADKSLKSLSSLEFVERFAETPIGAKLLDESKRRGKNCLKLQIDNLVSKYEEYGEHTREYFAKRAQLISIVISILVACVLNLHAYDLFKTFLIDKDIRQTVIAQGESAAQALQAQLIREQSVKNQSSQEQLKSEKEAQEKENREKENQKKQAEQKAVTSQSSQAAVANEKAITENIKQLQALEQSLRTAGIPMGWTSIPFSTQFFTQLASRKCWLTPDSAPSGFFEKASCQLTWTIQWMASALFTGLLIGLGGPFWFNAYKKILALTGAARGVQSAVQRSKETEKNLPEKVVEAVEVFEQAVEANRLDYKPVRAILSSDGKIEKE